MVEAYNSEASSCGYWPGGAEDRGVFSAYPEPNGFRGEHPSPSACYFDRALGEFVLPYPAVRQESDPDRFLLEFFRDTHRVAVAEWPAVSRG